MSESDWLDCGNGVRCERAVRFELLDGVHLVSDHYYPQTPGPHPTLLMRQPYGRDIASTVVYAHPSWFAKHNYNVVIQDVRGRGDSEGDFYPFRHEGKDGAATIAWLKQRPESNGRIGMYGFSYQGATQLLAAAEQPEGLQCISPAMTAHDLYHGWFYKNGALRLATTLGWGLQMLKADARKKKLKVASDRLEQAWSNIAAQYLHLPFRENPALQAESSPQYVLDWLDHDRSGGYWESQDASKSANRINVPALHISGWYDMFLEATIAGFQALRKNATTRHARENQFLVAGPWQHIPWSDRIGPGDFGREAQLDTDAILLRWFNHWLKDSGEFSDEPRVRHFVLHENRWRAGATFPGEAKFALHLHSSGKANSGKGDGTLSTTPAAAGEPADIFLYDPEVPVIAPGGLTAAPGPFDQSQIEAGNNVLVYSTPPLEKPIRIFGIPYVILYAATTASHTDFTAKLVRVRPNHIADFICIGIARSRYLFREQGYTAKKINLWHFSLEPTSCFFAAGDRIRLEIASSAFPLFDRNPGTAVPSPKATSWDWQRSTQIIHHDGDHPSTLYLPVAEESEIAP
jgi:putative CocE/NonD family hydrolase